MTLQKENEDCDTESLCTCSDDERTPFQIKTVRAHHNKRSKHVIIIAAIAYLILGALYIKLWVSFRKLESQLRTFEPELFPSLEKSTVFRRDSRVFPLTVAGTPFAGVPTPELDQAWHGLLEGTTIRVAKEDLDYYNVTSLPLADGSGFASEIFMTHELHCLKKVRQWVYKESYFDHVQGLARNELQRHVDHCIETLRQGILCRGDVSLGTYTYLSGSNDVTARSWASHQCVDSEALLAWAKARSINIFEDGVLVKPEDLGPEHVTQKTEPH